MNTAKRQPNICGILQHIGFSVPAAVLAVLFGFILCGCGVQQTGADKELNQYQPEETADYSDVMLRFSEVMLKNRAALADETGGFPDWVELENAGGQNVSLSGWTISDGKRAHQQSLPAETLAPGEFAVVFCRDFAISEGEKLFLYDPNGKKRCEMLCSSAEADHSLSLQADGSMAESKWISPGFPNGKYGYDLWNAASLVPANLIINEVSVLSLGGSNPDGSQSDWVEFKNNSTVPLDLGEYHLSDRSETAGIWSFPSVILQPGELAVFSCDSERPVTGNNTGFSLNAADDQLYLYHVSGVLVDYVSMHDIPVGGSMGRMDGEAGFFYFPASTPATPNRFGMRRVSDLPVTLTAEGPHNNVDQISVELQSDGSIYYTLDESIPTQSSWLYSGPITLTETGVIRAVSVENGALPSRTATFSYFLNENHVFPILSLVTEDKETFSQMYRYSRKLPSVPANLALYENGETRFSHECELSMKGWTSLSLPKKSMGVEFKGRYGGNLHCDVFGNGITEYRSLSLRAGQDYPYSFFRNELFQELCLEASDSLYTQESKYCILYLNGDYYGIYCLKEDFSEQYYASHAGVSVGSVEGFRAPADYMSEYNMLVQGFGQTADMKDPENYQKICDRINIDSLIDWFLFESWCANTDTQANQRIYRSAENGNRWEYAFYDLDWGLWYHEGNFRILLYGVGNVGSEMPGLISSLMKNPDFRDRVLTRYSELISTVLSDEYVLAKIDEYVELLSPEMPRDRDRWNLRMKTWYDWVDSMRDILRSGYADYTIDTLCKCQKIGREERARYFG